MPDEKTYDPVLLRATQGILNRQPPTRGAGLFDSASVMRTLGLNQPRIMGGGSRNKPTSYIPENYTRADVRRFVEYLGGKVVQDRKAYKPETKTEYLKFKDPHENPENYTGSRIPTVRFPDPDDPHIAHASGFREKMNLFDTSGPNAARYNNADRRVTHNAAGQSYKDPEALMNAIKWRISKGLVPEGSQPPFTRAPKPEPIPIDQILRNDPNQGQMFTIMRGDNTPQKLPNIVGGSPEQPLSSQSMSQRFNLVTPQDLGNFGSKSYDPLTDPSYLQLMALVRKYSKPPGNDRY